MDNLLNGQIGDIVSLSDFQTCAEFKSTSVDFRICRVREYNDPEDRFSIKAYELEGPNEDTPFMLVHKQVGSDCDLFVYYLDTFGELDGDSENPYYNLFTEDQGELLERIEVLVHYDDDEEQDITWDVQDQTHGVRYEDSEGNEGVCTLAEYFTNDNNNDNNFCLIDWKGDEDDGEVEMWYGCNIKNTEVELFCPKED